jgi:competence protein ComEA
MFKGIVKSLVYGVEKININTAQLEELTSLYMVGPNEARAIVAYREKNGPFASIEDLEKVEGLDSLVAEANADIIVTRNKRAEKKAERDARRAQKKAQAEASIKARRLREKQAYDRNMDTLNAAVDQAVKKIHDAARVSVVSTGKILKDSLKDILRKTMEEIREEETSKEAYDPKHGKPIDLKTTDKGGE